jgi:transposase
VGQAKPLSDAEVEARLFSYVGRSEPATRAAIDFNWVHAELGRVGVTLQLLWGDYETAARKRGAQPYQYSQFCELYASFRDRRRLSMRQAHRPGEKLFLDYSGKKPRIADPETGEVTDVELFVGVLAPATTRSRRRRCRRRYRTSAPARCVLSSSSKRPRPSWCQTSFEAL